MKFKRRRLTLGQSRLPRGFQEPPLDRIDLIDPNEGRDLPLGDEGPWMSDSRARYFHRAFEGNSPHGRSRHATDYIDYIDPEYLPEPGRVSRFRRTPEFPTPRVRSNQSREYRLFDVDDQGHRYYQSPDYTMPQIERMSADYTLRPATSTVPTRYAVTSPRREFIPTVPQENPAGWRYAGESMQYEPVVQGDIQAPKKNIFGRLTKKARQVDFNILEAPDGTSDGLSVEVVPRDRPDIAVQFHGRIHDKQVRKRTKRIFDIGHAYTLKNGLGVPWEEIKNSALSKAQLKDASSYLKMNFPELQGAHGIRQTGIHSRTGTPQHVTFDAKRLGLLPFPKSANALTHSIAGREIAFSPFVQDLYSRRPLKLGKMAWAALPAAVAAYTIGSSIKHGKDKE